METASVSHDEEHQHAVISFADAAKVQRKSEVTKEKRYKKEMPPLESKNTNLIARSPNRQQLIVSFHTLHQYGYGAFLDTFLIDILLFIII